MIQICGAQRSALSRASSFGCLHSNRVEQDENRPRMNSEAAGRTVMKTTMQKPTTPALSSCAAHVRRSAGRSQDQLRTTHSATDTAGWCSLPNACVLQTTLLFGKMTTRSTVPVFASSTIGQGVQAHRSEVLGEAEREDDDQRQQQHDPAPRAGREERRRRAHQLQAEREALRGGHGFESRSGKRFGIIVACTVCIWVVMQIRATRAASHCGQLLNDAHGLGSSARSKSAPPTKRIYHTG